MNDFKIIGISTETTNANEQSLKDVEELWGKFWGENISDKIPNKESDEFYAVYTDYESDYTGKYTLIIGFPVTTLDNIPDGFVGRKNGTFGKPFWRMDTEQGDEIRANISQQEANGYDF